MGLNAETVDQAVLAVLQLTRHDHVRAWKGLDWDAMARLHQGEVHRRSDRASRPMASAWRAPARRAGRLARRAMPSPLGTLAFHYSRRDSSGVSFQEYTDA